MMNNKRGSGFGNTTTNPFEQDYDNNHSKTRKSQSSKMGGVSRSSTNPFEDDATNSATPPSAAPPIIHTTSQGVELHAATGGFRPSKQHGNGGYNRSLVSGGSSGGSSSSNSNSLWISRNVEWPVPHTIRASLLSGVVSAAAISSGSKLNLGILEGGEHGSDSMNDGDSGSIATGSYMPNITGLFSRVLPTNSASSSDAGKQDSHDGVTSSSGDYASGKVWRVMFPPKRCVASSNGWIVAAVEASNSVYGGDHSVRLISRWNVRRGSSRAEETIVTLPSPVSNNTYNLSTRIKGVFIDPTGCHVFISAGNGEAYHLHSSSKKARKLNGFGVDKSNTGTGGISSRAGFVTSIAWDRERGTEGSTKGILLGTSMGEIYEVSLMGPVNASDQPSSSNSGPDDIPVLLHELDCGEDGEKAAVTGLHFERVSDGRLFIVAVTSGIGKPTRIHRFRGSDDTLRSAFERGINSVDGSSHPSFVELPGSIDFAELCICGSSFALRSDVGIYYGMFNRDDGGGIADSGILPYENSNETPSSISITPHHYMTLSEDGEVLFISRISLKVIQRERVERSYAGGQEGGELLTDKRRPDQVWLRQGRILLHISSTMEDRDVWRLTLEKCLNQHQQQPSSSSSLFRGYQSGFVSPEEKAEDTQFDEARSLCTNTAQEAVVSVVRAEYHLARGRVELSAKYFAQSPPVLAPFSTTALRLCLPSLGIFNGKSRSDVESAKEVELASSNNALIAYLTDKLRVASEKNDTMFCAMLGAWLTELHLHEKERNRSRNLLRQGTRSLASFLSKNARHIDATTTIRILSSHDARSSECAEYAAASGDVGTAINAALSGDAGRNGALNALKILADAPFEKGEHYYYKHASTILARAPVEATTSFLARYQHGLEPTKLLPALMSYERLRAELKAKEIQLRKKELERGPLAVKENAVEDVIVRSSRNPFDDGNSGVEVGIGMGKPDFSPIENNGDATIKYLEGVIRLGCESSAIHTYLTSLLASMEDEEPLFRFLSTYVSSPKSTNSDEFKAGESSPLDLQYALRAVLKTGRHYRSAVKLYMGLNMRQHAVELALKVDPALARELARDSTEVEERKRLWLMIAKNAAADDHGGRDVVAKVLSVINDCGPDILSIEDVLPFLPDSAQIDQFREEICEALTAYSSKIEHYVQEMSECDQICETLRGEIARLGTLGTHMRADTRCAFTQKLVFGAEEPFYVFPSGYVVLESVLKSEVLPYLNEKQKSRVGKIEVDLSKIAKNPKDEPRRTHQEQEKLQAELDGLIAAECPLTGKIMIDSIDKGFSGMDED